MALGDVVDEFHDNDGLADARTTERTDLATLRERADEVDHLDASFEDLSGRILVGQRWSLAMNAIALGGLWRGLIIHGVAGDVENTTEHFFADWNSDRAAGVGDIHAALQTVGGNHRNGTHPTIAQVALHFADEALSFATEVEGDFKGVVDLRQLA